MMLGFLRRFSPARCDLPTIVDNLGFLLRTCAVNIDRKQRISVIVYALQILTGVIYFYVYQFSMFWFVFIRCRETGNLVAASVTFSLGTCSVTGVAKLVYILFNNDAVKDIIEEYLACDASVAPGSRFSSNLLKFQRVVKERATWFWLFLLINGLIYVAVPIIRPGRHFVEDLYVIYGLEPMFETPNYQIAFIIMTVGVYFGLPAEMNTSVFLTILVGYAEAQLLALSIELDNLWEDAYTSCQNIDIGEDYVKNKDIIVNERVGKLLRDIVKRQITVINLFGQVENIFRGAMVIEFGYLTLGLVTELLGGLENTCLQFPYTLTQIAMDCFIGQRLMDASLLFEKAVYSCKWERFDKVNQRTVYLMLVNSQKTLKFSVGGLTVLSFSCFMSVSKSIYSVYATLRTRI